LWPQTVPLPPVPPQPEASDLIQNACDMAAFMRAATMEVGWSGRRNPLYGPEALFLYRAKCFIEIPRDISLPRRLELIRIAPRASFTRDISSNTSIRQRVCEKCGADRSRWSRLSCRRQWIHQHKAPVTRGSGHVQFSHTLVCVSRRINL